MTTHIYCYLIMSITLLFSTNLLAECKNTECSETTDKVYRNSSVQLYETLPKHVTDRCVVSDRKPLKLRKSHYMHKKIEKLKPDAMKNKENLQIVLNENAEQCEITFVVLMGD